MTSDEPNWRVLEPLEGSPIALALAGGSVLERRGRGAPRHVAYADPLRAFVALANRARALAADGWIEAVPTAPEARLALASPDEIAAYASALDPTRSLPRQELAIAAALGGGGARDRRDPRVAEMIATLCLLEWPVAFDVGVAIGALDDPGPALAAVLARELEHDARRYPKELVRQAMTHGAAESCTLALRALARTRDPDAWLDVLIEGDPFFERSHAASLSSLAERAPSKDVAKMAREIARDLAPARRASRNKTRR